MGVVARFFGGVGRAARATKDVTTAVASAASEAAKSSFESTSGVDVSISVDPVRILTGTASVTGRVVGVSTGLVAKAAIVSGKEAIASSKALVDGYRGKDDSDPEIKRIYESL